MYLKRIITYSSLCLIGLSGFFGIHIEPDISNTSPIPFQISSIDTIYAGNTPTPAENKGDVTSSKALESYNKLIDALNMALAIISVMVSPVILFVGWLMTPDWTSGDLFRLRAPMYNLWVTVSNVVYFIYAILLILIALGTMFNQDKFSYKVMLPKLALGILMVPFTWWFVQWTISISSVITASVMSIPMETMDAIEAKSPSQWYSKIPSIPKNIDIGNGATKATDCGTDPGDCITPKDFMDKSGGIYGPLLVYGYSIFKFQKVQHIETSLDVASAALKLVHTTFISAIMFLIFGLLVIALAVILVVRAVKLWMYAIFAPLFTFQFVAGSGMMGEGNKDTFTLKEFIGLVFVPAIVGLTLSFGLIMIAAVQSPNEGGVTGNNVTTCDLTAGCKTLIMSSNNHFILRKWVQEGQTSTYKTTTTFTWGAMKINFLGSAVNQKNAISTTQGTLDSVGGIFGTIIINLIALVFIWVAFMAAKNVSRAVSAAVGPFEAIGNKIGKLAAGMPQYVPLPGVMGGSVRGLSKTVANTESLLEHKANLKYEDTPSGQWFKQQTNGASAADIRTVKEAVDQNGINGVKALQQASIQNRATGKGPQMYGVSQRENLDTFAEKVAKDASYKEHLESTYGKQIGPELYNRLSKGKITDEDNAIIISALLASKNGDTVITNVETARRYLKNESVTSATSSASASKTAAAPAAGTAAPAAPAAGTGTAAGTAGTGTAGTGTDGTSTPKPGAPKSR